MLGFYNDPRFEDEFEILKRDLQSAGYTFLLGSVLEIGAQYLIVNGQMDAGENCLREAEQLLKSEDQLRLMFVDKWRTIAQALKTKSVEPLTQFRQLALSRKHWETLRDLDYFRAMLQSESPWAAWVYFGTPHAAFRHRMEKSCGFPDIATVSRSGTCVQVIDPWFAGDQHGELSHLLMNLLLRDFYRPMRVGEIFSELFWNNPLDLNSSQDRVHQIIRRLRVWINKNNIPFKILEVEGSYAIRIAEDTGLVCRKLILPAQKLPFVFGRFHALRNVALTAQDWSERLNVTPSKTRTLLTQATQTKIIEVSGRGMATRYKLT